MLINPTFQMQRVKRNNACMDIAFMIIPPTNQILLPYLINSLKNYYKPQHQVQHCIIKSIYRTYLSIFWPVYHHSIVCCEWTNTKAYDLYDKAKYEKLCASQFHPDMVVLLRTLRKEMVMDTIKACWSAIVKWDMPRYEESLHIDIGYLFFISW